MISKGDKITGGCLSGVSPERKRLAAEKDLEEGKMTLRIELIGWIKITGQCKKRVLFQGLSMDKIL